MKFAAMKRLMIALAIAVVSLAAAATEHHFVGDNERGWETSSSRLFKVGDTILFSYPATGESIVELKDADEFLSCDLKNPIKMYTEGYDKVPLDGEGSRYFASANLESCKKGLKMHVNVLPREHHESLNGDLGPSSKEKYGAKPVENPSTGEVIFRGDRPYGPYRPLSPERPDEPHFWPAPEHSPPDEPHHTPPVEPLSPPDEPHHMPPVEPLSPPDEPLSPPYEPLTPPDEPHSPPDEPHYMPPEPFSPPDEPRTTPPPPATPSSSIRFDGFFVMIMVVGLSLCFLNL